MTDAVPKKNEHVHSFSLTLVPAVTSAVMLDDVLNVIQHHGQHDGRHVIEHVIEHVRRDAG